MTYYTNINSPWFPKLSKTKEWLKKQEELCLQGEKLDRPNTKWVFEKHKFIDLKVILDRQPLQIGLGQLPDWIGNKRVIISLDNYNDNYDDSIKATCWLEYVAWQSGTHIHHHRCGHGGEWLVAGGKVDGYHPETKTVFQFHGCFWHGCIKCFPGPEQRTEVIYVDRKGNEITRDAAYQKTLKRSELIRFLGYNLIKRWEHQELHPWWNDRLPSKRNDRL